MLLFDWTYLYNLNLKTDDTLKARFYHAVNLQIGHGLQKPKLSKSFEISDSQDKARTWLVMKALLLRKKRGHTASWDNLLE
jgi:hypothetical protein